jgi:hypothetical protein
MTDTNRHHHIKDSKAIPIEKLKKMGIKTLEPEKLNVKTGFKPD